MVRFTLAQLHAFTATVHFGSFHGASQALHLSQPSVSQRVAELERALDIRLFVRHGPRIELTPSGRELLPKALEMVRNAEKLASDFTKGGDYRGELRFGISRALSKCIPDLLRALARRYPGVVPSIHTLDFVTMHDMLVRGELDIATVCVAEKSTADLAKRYVGSIRLQWIVPASRSSNRRVHRDELADEHIFLTAPPSFVWQQTMQWFRDGGIQPSRVSFSTDPSITLEVVRQGLAIAVLPDGTLKALQRDGGSVQCAEVWPAMEEAPIYIAYRSSDNRVMLDDMADILEGFIRPASAL